MQQIVATLYENDPAGKEVSLKWTDGDVKGPFSNLDTIEKVIFCSPMDSKKPFPC